MDYIFFIHSSVEGHLGSFHSFSMVDIAAMNIGVHVPIKIKKMWYIYNVILFSHQKNEILPFAMMWMELEAITLSKINQRKKIII